MEKQPQFPFAPKDFARCLNATCPRSQNCLRRTAALQDTDEHLFLKVVNPLRYPKEGEECELFRSTDKVRMAWGVTPAGQCALQRRQPAAQYDHQPPGQKPVLPVLPQGTPFFTTGPTDHPPSVPPERHQRRAVIRLLHK